MMRIPSHPDFSKNRNRCKGDVYPCIVCGKPCNNPCWYLRVWLGDVAVLEEEVAGWEEKHPGGDLGLQPIGANCLKSNPELKPYAIKQQLPKGNEWKELYFDLYRQCFGENASDEECMKDASKRLETLSYYQ